MAPTLRRAGGGLLATLGLLTSLAAVVALRQLLPLPGRTDVPGGFAFLFALLLFLVGLGLLAAGTALLGGGADWVGGRARSVFRAAGYLVAGCLPVAVVAVALTGRIEIGVLVVVGGGLLGVLAVALGLAVGLASVAYRAVAG
jgi:hypothetical protein